MKVFRGLPNAASRAPCALTIGNFDGVHRGHQALLAQVARAGLQRGLESAVMTFEPHPREYFARTQGTPGSASGNAPASAPTRIANLRDKLRALAIAGIDRVIVEHFNAHFAALAPQAFIEQILVDGLHVKWLMVGEDFCFGARRAGTIALLIEAGAQFGFEVVTLPAVEDAGVRISSSATRAALQTGDFGLAERLLGRPYAISGHVIHGKKLGRTIGFPTVNLAVTHRHPVLSGIYAVQVHGVTEAALPGVASIGVRPTVDDSGRVLLETHLFDFAGDCYGKLIQVEFLQKLRDEETYPDLPTLTAAIARDAEQARAIFQKRRTGDAQTATGRI